MYLYIDNIASLVKFVLFFEFSTVLAYAPHPSWFEECSFDKCCGLIILKQFSTDKHS